MQEKHKDTRLRLARIASRGIQTSASWPRVLAAIQMGDAEAGGSFDTSAAFARCRRTELPISSELFTAPCRIAWAVNRSSVKPRTRATPYLEDIALTIGAIISLYSRPRPIFTFGCSIPAAPPILEVFPLSATHSFPLAPRTTELIPMESLTPRILHASPARAGAPPPPPRFAPWLMAGTSARTSSRALSSTGVLHIVDLYKLSTYSICGGERKPLRRRARRSARSDMVRIRVDWTLTQQQTPPLDFDDNHFFARLVICHYLVLRVNARKAVRVQANTNGPEVATTAAEACLGESRADLTAVEARCEQSRGYDRRRDGEAAPQAVTSARMLGTLRRKHDVGRLLPVFSKINQNHKWKNVVAEVNRTAEGG
ncbi:hypothetical protein C8J57DRAFT_1608377 [Mycena rebaudengoi]|nr:hypothetical protein C8J57DRAFT_1608377 [Mycena rebaudengoi]